MSDNRLIVQLNPQEVTRHTTTYQNVGRLYEFISELSPKFLTEKIAYRILKMEPFIKPPLKRILDIEEANWHKLILNYTEHTEYEQTIWYSQLMDALLKNGVVEHKGITMISEHQVHHFFQNYVDKLIESIKANGIICSKDYPAECGVIIDEDGSFVKSSHGNHRFAIARIHGLKKVPCVVEGISHSFVSHVPHWQIVKRKNEALRLARQICLEGQR